MSDISKHGEELGKMNAELIKALQANRDQRRAEKERESIDSETYSLNQIRDAAYEVLSRLPESEYEYAERLLWSFNEELEGESNE
jgi:hypothetical protein